MGDVVFCIWDDAGEVVVRDVVVVAGVPTPG